MTKNSASKAHFIQGMRYPLAADAQQTPPEPCHLAVGDLVTFQNDYGVKFFDRVVTGFSPAIEGGRFVYFDHEAWWFPVKPSSLIKQAHRMTDAPCSVDTEAEASPAERPRG